MKQAMVLSAVSLLALVSIPVTANAQNDTRDSVPAKTAVPSQPAQATVNLDVRDARLRDVLETLFKQAKVDFLIEPGVDGFVTMKVTDIPFEAALKLTLRAGSIPLVYTLENNVYIVRPRPVETPRSVSLSPPPIPETRIASSTPRFEVIQLLHADPADLAQLLNIVILPTGVRFGNTGFAGFGGLGGLTGGGLAGLAGGGQGARNGAQNTPGNNNGGIQGIGTPGGTIIFVP